MTDVVDTHEVPHGRPPVRGWHHLTAPGFIRAAWMMPLFWAIGAGIVLFFRWLGHYEPTADWAVLTIVAFTWS